MLELLEIISLFRVTEASSHHITLDIFAGDTRLTIPELPAESADGLVANEDLISRLEVCMSEWASVMQSLLQQEAHRQILGEGESSPPGSNRVQRPAG